MRGLVLEGGGAKGAYHVGVYKAILEKDIKIDGVTGTSIGAFNGAMIIQDDFDKCIKLWKNVSYSMIIEANEEEIRKLLAIKFDMEDFKFLGNKLRKIIKSKGLDIAPIKKLINQYIDEEALRKSKKDFGIVTVNLTDLKPIEIFLEDIPKGEAKNFILASSYLPVFQMEKIDGKRYLDGGFFDNLPFGMLVNKGYRDLILVRTNASGVVRSLDKKINAKIISPSGDLGHIFLLEQDSVDKNMLMGYLDALKVFNGLLGEKYYIKPKRDEEYFRHLLSSITENKIEKMGNLVNLPHMYSKEDLFNHVIPKVFTILGISKNFTYEEFLVNILEERAKKLRIKRLKIYTFEELLDLVKFNSKFTEEKTTKIFGKFIDIVDSSLILNRDHIVERLGDILF